MTDIEHIFNSLGGEFHITYLQFLHKLSKIKAILFDWDGVFNAGVKNDQTGSAFSEIDSMGTNLLRFGFWLKNNQIPVCSIITGESNNAAFYLAQREHFQSVYYKFKNKLQAFDHLILLFNLDPDQVAYVFDDVPDLSITQHCGLRFLVRRTASPLLRYYVNNNGMCDYTTNHQCNEYAVREICELILGATGMFNRVIEERIVFSEFYTRYLNERQGILTRFFTNKDNQIIENQSSSTF